MQPLHLETVPAGAYCALVRVAGEVDVYSVPQLRECVTQLLAVGIRHIIADLREVDFLDSTGLGALVGSLKRLREQDGSLDLVTAPGRISQLFRITGLDRIFALHGSVSAAIAGHGHWTAALAAEGHDADEWCRKHSP